MSHSEDVEYCESLPAPDLRPYVACYWALRGPGGAAERVLPDGRAELVVHLGDPFADQARCLFIGQQRQAVTIRPTGRVHVFGVRFHAAGAAAFLGMAQSELAERIVPLDLLWNRAAREWETAMHEARSDDARVAATDAMLRGRLLPRGPAMRVRAAVGAMAADPFVRMDAVAEQAGVSRRQLEREFLQSVGLPPKAWARIVRLQRALAVRRERQDWAWARIALECGYYDQAHLIGDCRRITGLAPLDRESAETAMERMLVANFQDAAGEAPVG